jgi:hypothetical protein
VQALASSHSEPSSVTPLQLLSRPSQVSVAGEAASQALKLPLLQLRVPVQTAAAPPTVVALAQLVEAASAMATGLHAHSPAIGRQKPPLSPSAIWAF